MTLPSWRDGPTRRAILDFVERADVLRPEHRVAVFDNDGTLWCEKPNYIQVDGWAVVSMKNDWAEVFPGVNGKA